MAAVTAHWRIGTKEIHLAVFLSVPILYQIQLVCFFRQLHQSLTHVQFASVTTSAMRRGGILGAGVQQDETVIIEWRKKRVKFQEAKSGTKHCYGSAGSSSRDGAELLH